MARMFEALQQMEPGRRPPVAASSPAPTGVAAAQVPQAVEEVPFIEVGGARIEASPTVLACKGPHADTRANPPIIPLPSARATATVEIAETNGAATAASITFHPLADVTAPAQNRLASELIAYHQPEHPLSHQYRSVLDHLVTTARAFDARILLMSGIASGCGTTTVLLNLAITHARDSQQRVLVADAHVHRPALAQRLSLNPVPGLREVLSGVIPLHRTLQETGQSNLEALPLGDEGTHPALPMHSLGTTLRHLRKRFDLVLVDAPTWHNGAEMLALASACDALFLVLPQHQAETAETKNLFQSILRQGIRLRGCLLTSGQ